MTGRILYWKQEEDNRKWQAIPDTQKARESAIRQGAMFSTWSSLSGPYKGDGHPEPIRCGDLPLDFDSKDDPGQTLKDLRHLCLLYLPELFDLDPYSFRFFLSGGKGFHAVIPAELFNAQGGDPCLPLIYKKIVSDWKERFELKTLDMSLYCMGRGKMFRIANIKRNNGQYKVPISLEEVRDLSYNDLWKLGAAPREIDPVDVDLSPNMYLVDQFKKCRKEVYGEIEKQKTAPPVKRSPLPKKMPDCIKYILTECPKTKSTTNLLFTNLAAFFQTVGASFDEALNQVGSFLANYSHSTGYTTAEARIKHFKDQWQYIEKTPKYKNFRCEYILGLGLPGSAFECKKCSLNRQEKGQRKQAKKDIINTHSKEVISEKDAKKKNRRLKVYHSTDMGNAERLADAHGQDLRFCYPFNKWLVWDGIRWTDDNTGELKRKCKDVVRGIYAEAAKLVDEDQRKKLAKYAMGCESDYKIKAMISLAQSEKRIPVLPEHLDTDPYLLNCLNGTVDLRTGGLTPHKRGDLITKLAPVNYDPTAECQTWLDHLDKIMAGNEALIRFLQRAFGYSLTGDASERKIFIEFGSGANGKTITNDTIALALGDYAMRTPTETLLIKRNEGIPNDVARLRGARFVYASEAEQGKRLAESLIKDMSGGEKITARFMRAEWFEFYPEFKIWLGTNHKPIIRGTDHAIWDRIRLIPFTVRIPEHERIPRTEMLELFKQEMGGILAWLVEGCLAWQREGLGVPEEVEDATNEYRAEMDILNDFISDRCITDSGVTATAKVLFEEYESWAEDNGEKAISKKLFGIKLSERRFEAYRATRGVRTWRGIGVTRDA